MSVCVLVELAREPLQFCSADETFLARILDGLAGQSQPPRRFHHVHHAFRHGRDWQPFVGGHITWWQFTAMNHDPLRFLAPQSCTLGNGEMDAGRIDIRDPIHTQRSFVGKRDLLGALARARP